MNKYEVIKRKVTINNTAYARGDKLSLPEEVYLSYQDSLKLLEKITKKKSKKVKSNVIKDQEGI